MNLTRCSNGHFYDSDKYSSCPHCAGSSNVASNDVTVAMRPDDTETVAISGSITNVPSATQSMTNKPDDDMKTIRYVDESGVEPVVGWLVVTKGKDVGADFRLKIGRNFIGRSQSMDVVLKNDKTVSRDKHSIVVYDPKSCSYIVQPGASKELCYLNDEVVLSPEKLKAYDVITVGETNLLFIPLCSKDGFNWDDNEANNEE